MSRKSTLHMVFLAVALIGAAPPAGDGASGRVLRDLIACRAIAADAARLACFDTAAGAFADASDKGDIRVIDREDVSRTRRALFGFAIPDIGVFGPRKSGSGKDPADADVVEVAGEIAAVSGTRDGGYAIVLKDGARWEQTDSVTLGRTPRPGMPVTIARGALGSYKMRIAGGPAMKMRRVR